jgi:transcriptional regulator with XRE-family HTH domain
METQGKKPNDKLRYFREIRGWSQWYVAERIGTSETEVSRWESGTRKPGRYYQAKLCELFAATALDLGFMEAPPSVPSPGKQPEQTLQERTLPFPLSQAIAQSAIQTVYELERTDYLHTTFIPRWYKNDVAALQMPLQTLLGGFDAIATGMGMSQEQYHSSQRQILVALAAWPLAKISLEQSHSGTYTAEVFLTQCASSLVACHRLIKSQDFWYVKQILTRLVPSLVHILQQSSLYQATAAHLVAQCYLLLGVLESHQLNWSGYQSLNECALQMSLLTSDTNLQVVASVQLAMAFFHFEQPSKALSLYQGAKPLVEVAESSPLVQSNFYAKQAVAYAQAGQVTNMQRCLERAHTLFPKKPEDDAGSLVTDFSSSGFISWETTAQLQLVRRQLETPTNVWKTLSQADQLSPHNNIKALVYIQNLRAETALALNDLELFMSSLAAGIQGAKQLRSARRLQEAMDCYRIARKQWPNETRLQELAERFVEESKEKQEYSQ